MPAVLKDCVDIRVIAQELKCLFALDLPPLLSRHLRPAKWELRVQYPTIRIKILFSESLLEPTTLCYVLLRLLLWL